MAIARVCLNAQCVVGPDRQILSLFAVCVGASHDAVAWAASDVGRDIAQDQGGARVVPAV